MAGDYVRVVDRLDAGGEYFKGAVGEPGRRCCLNCRWWVGGTQVYDGSKRCTLHDKRVYPRDTCDDWQLWRIR